MLEISAAISAAAASSASSAATYEANAKPRVSASAPRKISQRAATRSAASRHASNNLVRPRERSNTEVLSIRNMGTNLQWFELGDHATKADATGGESPSVQRGDSGRFPS